MAQDNSLWNSVKQAIQIPLMSDVAKSATVTGTAKGIGGYELTMRESEVITLETSITDYYAEDNSNLQDNIALRPLKFTINGIVAEKFQDVRVSSTIASTMANALMPVLSLMPDVSSFVLEQAFVIEAMAGELMEAIETGASFVEQLIGTSNEGGEGSSDTQNDLTNQQKAFVFFYSAYKARELFEVSLPFCTINNCAIESVEITQPAETASYSSLKISFKQMNFATTQSTVGSSSIGRRKAQASPTPATNLSNLSVGAGDAGNVANVDARWIN